MPRPHLSRSLHLALHLLLAGMCGAAWADPPPAPPLAGSPDTLEAVRIVHGTLVRIDEPEYVVDLGRSQGVLPGAKLRMYRTIHARHPLTHKEVVDRFAVCETVVAAAADRLCIALPDALLAKSLRVGDPVEAILPEETSDERSSRSANHKGKRGAVQEREVCAQCPTCPPQVPSPAAENRSPEAVDADAVFQWSMGRTPAERISAWRAFVLRHQRSAYLPAIAAEMESLERQDAIGRQFARDAQAQQRATEAARKVHHDRLQALRVGDHAWLTFAAADWSGVQDLRIHIRLPEQTSWLLLRPELCGAQVRRVHVPVEAIRAPGFAYFAEATLPDGKERPVAGSLEAPLLVEVTHPFADTGPAPRDATTFRTVAEFVDFNRMRGDDRIFSAQGALQYHLQDSRFLYAFEMGYGLYNGISGAVAHQDLLNFDGTPSLHGSGAARGQPIRKDDTLNPRRTSLKYSYIGAEWQFVPVFHMMTRLVVGLDAAGLTSGLELGARIGPERGTNLALAASTLADLGRAASVTLTMHVLDDLPMRGIFEVTNRPVREDIGVRLIYEAEYRATRVIGLTGRVGYNLRTIDHAGVSFGGGLALHW